MKILVISDVHGNLPALENVLKNEKKFDLIISLGDVVNYGPWSNECVELLETFENKILLKGNHEDSFISGNYTSNNIISKTFFDFCYPKFKKKNEISCYAQEYQLNQFIFCHTIENKYLFEDSEIKIDRNYFIGHSHQIFKREIGEFLLVNTGSVGQNRKNIDEINYVLYYPLTNKIELKRIIFSSDILVTQMKNDNYPQLCIDYILSKKIK
ncbi:MAG: metallophosphoesterase [Bacteroidota bacterium]|jgi:predicted phosphodiesterase